MSLVVGSGHIYDDWPSVLDYTKVFQEILNNPLGNTSNYQGKYYFCSIKLISLPEHKSMCIRALRLYTISHAWSLLFCISQVYKGNKSNILRKVTINGLFSINYLKQFVKLLMNRWRWLVWGYSRTPDLSEHLQISHNLQFFQAW